MRFVIPDKKIAKLKSRLTTLIDEFPNLRVRGVASIAEFIISLSCAIGPIARLFTRQMYFLFKCERHGMTCFMHQKEFCTSSNFGGVMLKLLMAIQLTDLCRRAQF